MKRILTNILMAVGITVPFVTNLAAQSQVEVAKIPFAFIVSNVTMPAGTYDVARLTGTTFSFHDGRGHSVMTQLSVGEDGKPEHPSLTFACYGKDCVLAKVTPPDSERAYAISKRAIEKNLTHTLGIATLLTIKLAPR
jgi:hypothetical protein